MTQSETISKLDAAERQLETALHLWLNDLDRVSILTLAASAHQIIHDLNQKSGGQDLFFDTLNIKDEFRREFVQLVKGPWNFLKHSDKEGATDTIVVRDDLILMFLLFSTKGLSQLGRPPRDLRGIFVLWYGINFPESVRSRERFRTDFRIDEETEKFLKQLPRTEFLNAVVAASNSISLPPAP